MNHSCYIRFNRNFLKIGLEHYYIIESLVDSLCFAKNNGHSDIYMQGFD